jgi:hypothetical protein
MVIIRIEKVFRNGPYFYLSNSEIELLRKILNENNRKYKVSQFSETLLELKNRFGQ